MSRSRKKTTFGNYANGNKFGKKVANKKFRLKSKCILKKGGDIYPLLREVSNVYDFASDGLGWYFTKVEVEDMLENDRIRFRMLLGK